MIELIVNIVSILILIFIVFAILIVIIFADSLSSDSDEITEKEFIDEIHKKK